MKSDLTTSSEPPPSTLELIDQAEDAAKRAAHASGPQSRERFEYALALIRECWIGEDGQQAWSAAQVIADITEEYRIVAAAFRLAAEQTDQPHA